MNRADDGLPGSTDAIVRAKLAAWAPRRPSPFGGRQLTALAIFGSAMAAVFTWSCSAAQHGHEPAPASTIGLGHHFRGSQPIEATFVLLDDSTGKFSRFAQGRAARRARPASTFKIPNTIIALEEGVAGGPEFALSLDNGAVDTAGFFPASWRGRQTLRSAFRNSVAWYYQELARRIGAARMQRWLNRLEYGNRSLAGGVDRFWLDGGLRISADEQVVFLRRLRRGDFGISRRSLDILDEISLLAESADYRLHGKTGTSEVTATRENGWIVGWLEADHRTLYFALNMEGETVWEDWPPDDRVGLVVRIFRELGVIP